MKNIAVLGAGRMGAVIAKDLADEFVVKAFDADADTLQRLADSGDVYVEKADLADPAVVSRVVEDVDLVVGAVPGHMGFATLQSALTAGTNVVDISFFPEDPFTLGETALRHEVTAVVDCGVAPGLCNLILGAHLRNMDVFRYDCLVGGLPAKPKAPFFYKAPFSPIDVIEEYTRPASVRIDGKIVKKDPLDSSEEIYFEEVGTLEAFDSDGLRTLLKTVEVPNMRERTLRYPGHLSTVKLLKEVGLFEKDPVDLDGMAVRPLDVTAALLFPKWRLEEDEADFTLMRVSIEGTEDGEPKRYDYELLDRYDPATQTSSMARATGFTCAAVARLVLSESFGKPGVWAPEQIALQPGCFEKIMDELRQKGLKPKHSARLNESTSP